MNASQHFVDVDLSNFRDTSQRRLPGGPQSPRRALLSLILPTLPRVPSSMATPCFPGVLFIEDKDDGGRALERRQRRRRAIDDGGPRPP